MNVELRAYLATLAALIFVFTITLFVVAWKPEVGGKLEMFGLGTLIGGLIGLLRAPRFSGPPASPEPPPDQEGE